MGASRNIYVYIYTSGPDDKGHTHIRHRAPGFHQGLVACQLLGL